MEQAAHARRGRDWWLWVAVLLCGAILGSIVATVVFAPGGLTNDTDYQYQQAAGLIALNDWHPPVMSLLWGLLLDVTGKLWSILVVQQVALWGGAFLLALYVWDVTHSRTWSLMALAVPALPHVFGISGAVWKDVHMSIAFFLTLVLTLLALRFPRLRYALVFLALVALVYGTLVRKNAVFAVVPLVVLMTWAVVRGQGALARVRGRWVRPAVLSGVGLLVFGLVLGASNAVLTAVAKPQPADQLSQVFLDDIIFSVPADEIRASSAPQELKDKLTSAKDLCREKEAVSDAYWKCYGTGENGEFTPVAYPDEIRALWLDTVPGHPARYGMYRAQVYTAYLFQTRYQWGGYIGAFDYAEGQPFPQANDAGRMYVEDFGTKNLPWLFGAWFWLLAPTVGLIALAKARGGGAWRGRDAAVVPAVAALLGSALIYQLAYIPIIPETDYRYTYWPAVASTVAGILVIAAVRRGRKVVEAEMMPDRGVADGGEA